MEKTLLQEINRVREIMGVINEQETKIVYQDGKRFERTVSDIPPYESDKWRAEFASGKFSSSDLDGTPDLTGLVKWLNEPDKVGLKLVVAVTAGTSRVPVKPGGDVDKALQKIGKTPNNEGLAMARGETAVEMVKNQIKNLIPEEVFNNVEFTVDLSKVEQGPEWDEIDATAQKYTDHQFLTTTAFGTGQQETLSELPEICNTEIDGSGNQAEEESAGPTGLSYAAYPENEGYGKHYDLGADTEGQITFNFTAYHIPDMFQITYPGKLGQTYTSSGPLGEGFVSNNFKTCEEGSRCYNRYMNKINRLKRKITTGEDKVETYEGKTKTISTRYANMLNCTHGIMTPKKIGREWILSFWEKFEPGTKNWFKKAGDALRFTNKKKKAYNKSFTDGYTKYDENCQPNARAKILSGKDVWNKINDIWVSLDDKLEDVQKSTGKKVSAAAQEIQELENDLRELMAFGDPGEYSKKMTKELLDLGFDTGVIGTNGSITFDKIKGEGDMYLQVYAPLDGTVWAASITCKEKTIEIASN